jgi:hypothetical protein
LKQVALGAEAAGALARVDQTPGQAGAHAGQQLELGGAGAVDVQPASVAQRVQRGPPDGVAGGRRWGWRSFDGGVALRLVARDRHGAQGGDEA